MGEGQQDRPLISPETIAQAQWLAEHPVGWRPTPDAEQIVRALATADPGDYDTNECVLCGGSTWDSSREAHEQPPPSELHDATCPWRLAQEWVAAHPA